MNFAQLADMIRLALRKEGFARRIARRKPLISEVNRLLRLQWALEHLNWTREQWNTILWSDETWVTGRKYTRTWVIRRSDKVYHLNCIEEKLQRYRG